MIQDAVKTAPDSPEPRERTVRIVSVEAIPVQVPASELAVGDSRACEAQYGPAGDSPQWPGLAAALGSLAFEAALIRITTDNGLIGWGETQAPLSAQAIGAIVEMILRPVLAGVEFGGTTPEIEAFWSSMYAAMRVRGLNGGLIMDAIAGIDLALWDLAGKMHNLPVSRLLSRHTPKSNVEAYVSRLSGETPGQQAESAEKLFAQGFRNFKIHYDRDLETLLQRIVGLRARLGSEVGIAVDALWRLSPWTALPFGRILDEQNALWLECPLPPEHYAAHGDLAKSIRTRVALGESYRSCFELMPFFQARAMSIVQPDIGRCGLTEAMRIAEVGAIHNSLLVPHVSFSCGPQLAAALQLASACPNCRMIEYKSWQLPMVNRFLAGAITIENGQYRIPGSAGLGIEINL